MAKITAANTGVQSKSKGEFELTKSQRKELIHVYHIGSRSSAWSDNPLDSLRKNVYFTLFDADKESVEKDQHSFQAKNVPRSHYRFLPLCISSKKERRVFHITRDPMASSLLEFNSEFNEFVTTSISFDYSLKDACTTAKKETISCISVDDLSALEDFPPDFLSLDTEGSEHEILQGAKKVLKSDVLGVRSEVSFAEVRKKQKLFTEMHCYLAQQGFLFVRLEGPRNMNYAESLSYARGTGFAYAAEALFIKDYKVIIKSNLPTETKIQQLFKLAAVALTFNLFDYAYRVLLELHQSYSQELEGSSSLKPYVRLGNGYYHIYQQLMKRDFRKQQKFASNTEFWKPAVASSSESSGKSKSMLRSVLGKNNQKILWRSYKKGIALLSQFHLTFASQNKLELLLHKHGLVKPAAVLKKSRIEQAWSPKKIAKKLLIFRR